MSVNSLGLFQNAKEWDDYYNKSIGGRNLPISLSDYPCLVFEIEKKMKFGEIADLIVITKKDFMSLFYAKINQ